MKTFSYTITDPSGIHARPAGILVKKAGEFKSAITIKKQEKSGDAKRIFAVMSLGCKQGDEIIFEIDGNDEDIALNVLQSFCKENI
ncbi:MAG: HPr family phosphocarrier protein [Oscillospiraceae bacterium]|nr:HPr family phosphocarrier protein [Oscillospiraceae bacterium]